MEMAYVLGSIASLLALFLAPTIWRRMGGYKFLLLITGLDILSILLFAFSKNILGAMLIFILGFSLNSLIIFSLDEILKIFSRNSSLGKIRGAYLAWCSLAWIIAQFLFGTVLGNFPLRKIYLLASALLTAFFILSLLALKNIPDPIYDKMKVVKYVKKFFSNRNLFRAYGISLLLQLFYCWMVIYTPIHLSAHLGFSWKEIGIIFTIMLLPFFIIPFRLGKIADRIGERKMLMLGFAVASFFTFILFFIREKEVWLWALALFATRLGAATIETMSDTYFFKHIKPENEEFIGIYRNTMPGAYILGPLIALVFFLFVPSFNFIYPLLGTLMLFGVYLSSTIRKSDI